METTGEQQENGRKTSVLPSGSLPEKDIPSTSISENDQNVLVSIMKSPGDASSLNVRLGNKRKKLLRFEPRKKTRQEHGAEDVDEEGQRSGDEWEEEEDEEGESSFPSDNNLEKKLEEDALRNNLSTINVKSILHHVITNEQFQAFVRKEEGKTEVELDYEPKLTRSKVKSVVEAEEPVPVTLWPISPLKKPPKEGPQFAELAFSEDSSGDEDYKPDQDDLNKSESDYESLASHLSDLGSPYQSTPSLIQSNQATPQQLSAPQTPATPCPVEDQSQIAPAREVEEQFVDNGEMILYKDETNIGANEVAISKEDAANTEEMLAALRESNSQLMDLASEEQQAVNDETIAKRTRSKFPIEQPLEEIEAQFVAPDATKDLYDVAVEDEDWQKWLATLFRDAGADMSDGNDDDQNDPEFNYLAEQEKMPKDMEDYRNDRAVRISKKELGELLTEVMAEYGDTSVEPSVAGTSAEVTEEATVTSPGKGKQGGKPALKRKVKKMSSKRIAKRRAMLEMSQADRDLVQQQLQQHVQLLCQLYLLTRDTPRLQHTSFQSQHFLNELNHFANVFDGGSQSGRTSCFRVSNLEEAVNIVNQPYEPEVDSVLPAGRVPLPIPENAVDVMATSKVFMYPELLPTTGCPVKQSKKVVFTEAEDKLVVLGLEQFKGLSRPEELIVEHMLPIKTEDQIICRIKNCVSARSVGNIIKDYKKHKLMPKIKRVCKTICKGDEKPPVQMVVKKMPPWVEKFLKQHPEYGERPSRAIQPKVQSNTLQIAGNTGVQYVQVGPNSEGVFQQTPLGTQVQDTPSKGEAISVDLSQPQSRLGSQLSVRALDKKSRKKKKRKSSGKGKSSVNSPLLPANAVIAKAPPLSGCIITVNPTGGVPMITINTTPQLPVGVPLQGTNLVPANNQILTVNSTVGIPGTSQNVPKSSPSRDPRLQMLKKKRDSPAKRHAFAVLKSSPKGSSALRQYRLGRGLRQKYQWTNAHRAKVRKGLNFGAKDKGLTEDGQNGMDFDSIEENSNLETDPDNPSPSREDVVLPDGDASLTNQRAVLPEATSSSGQAGADRVVTGDGGDRSESRKRTFDELSGRDRDGNAVADRTETQSKYDNESTEASRVHGKVDLIEEEIVQKEGEQNTGHESDAGNMEDVDVDVTGDEEGAIQGEMNGTEDKGHLEGAVSMKENIHPETGKASTGTLKFAPKRGKRRKLVTKKMRNKMKRDSEIRKKLLDPQILETDEQKEGREIAFSKMFLQNAKQIFQNTPNKYVELLNYFKDFSEDSSQGLVDLCEKVFTLLEDHPKLILQFTAFLPLSTARELRRLQESLEFVKVRLFLRQVEVYFSKQQSHYQKIISTILEWEEDQLPPAAMLKENILPLLKGQPQLLQSFMCLFADEEVKDPANSRFEVLQLDTSDKQHDSYEEIDFTDSEEEQDGPDRIQPLLKSRRVVVEVEDDPYAKPRINFRRRTADSPKGGVREVESDGPSEDEALSEKKANDSSQAVSHLSQMCDNLADYLNENAAATEDEDIEVDTELDTELDTEIEDGDIDDADTEGHEAEFDHMISGDSMDEGPIGEGDKGPEGPDVEKYPAPDSHESKEADIDVDGEDDDEEEKHHLEELSSPLGSSHDSKHSKHEELSDDINVLSNTSSGSFASVSNENSQDSEYESSKVKSFVIEKMPSTEYLSANEEDQEKTLTCSFETQSGSDSEKDRTLVDSAHEQNKSPRMTSDIQHANLDDTDSNPRSSVNDGNTERIVERDKSEKQIHGNSIPKAGIEFNSPSLECEMTSTIHLQNKRTPDSNSSAVNKNEMLTVVEKQKAVLQGKSESDSSLQPISTHCLGTSASEQTSHEGMRETKSQNPEEFPESMEGVENTKTETSSFSSILHDESSQISANNLCVDGSGHVIVSWSRDTDQLLLQCVRENHDKPDKFEKVAQRLKDKTPSQVESRYKELMCLFHAMQDGTDEEELDQTDGGERSSQSKASTTDQYSP